MLYTKEHLQELQDKWEYILCSKCEICNGQKYVGNNICKCKQKATRNAYLEVFNIPMRSLQTNKEHILNINFSFKDYFQNIQNETYNIQNLYLYNFTNELNLEIIGYIAKKTINTKRANDIHSITVYYELFENLIQMSLRSNLEKDVRNRMNEIIYSPYILFIDGLGVETGMNSTTKHNVKLLNLILKERMNRCKSTVISSKLSYQQIEQLYGQETMSFLQNYMFLKG